MNKLNHTIKNMKIIVTIMKLLTFKSEGKDEKNRTLEFQY